MNRRSFGKAKRGFSKAWGLCKIWGLCLIGGAPRLGRRSLHLIDRRTARAFWSHGPQGRTRHGGRGAVPGLSQGVAQARHDQPTRQSAIAEPHLRFCWMHVHIHLMRITIEKQRHRRMTVTRQEISIRSTQGANQQLIAHWSPVNKEILLHRRAARIGGQCSVSGHMQTLALSIDAQRIFGKVCPQYAGQTAMQRIKHIARFRISAKRNARTIARHIGQGKAGKRLGHCQPLDHITNGLCLCAVAAHEF